MPHPTPELEPDIAALRLHLARLRSARGLSYTELAARAGISRSTLVYLENGKPNKTDRAATVGNVVTWFRLAQALELPIGELLAPLYGEGRNV